MDQQLEAKKQTMETWNRVADGYQDRFMDLALYNHTYDALLQTLPASGANVLELGCGPGNITRYLLEKRPDLEILGVDAAPAMVALAQKNNPEASFNVLEVSQLSTLGKRVDAVVAGFVLPYLDEAELQKMMTDSANLLTSKGQLYLSTIEGTYNPEGVVEVSSQGLRMLVYYYEELQIRSVLEGAGFAINRLFRIPFQARAGKMDTHLIFLAQKGD